VLYHAAQKGQCNIVVLLINSGADVHARVGVVSILLFRFMLYMLFCVNNYRLDGLF
jgi:hypothetical protein